MDLPRIKDQFIAAAREYYAAMEALAHIELFGDNSEAIAIRADLATRAMESAMHELDAAIENDKQPFRHGKDCYKALHDNPLGGYLHDESDDSPFMDDGVKYCGRCHFSLD